MKFLVYKYSLQSDDEKWMPRRIEDLQHIMVVGGVSSDKEACVERLLHRLYGRAASNIKEVEYTIANYGSNVTKVNLRHSRHHLIMQPNNSALDKYIIQEVIVDFCRKNDMCFYNSKTPFKCVVIRKADSLSEHAQFCLRRVMETTTRLCRFILVCSNPCNFILPIRSRFTQINIPTPKQDEVSAFIRHIASQEDISIDDNFTQDCGRDLRTLLWKLESRRHAVDYHCWWEEKTDEIVESLLSQTNRGLRSITSIRDAFGQLFITNIDAELILLRMMKVLFTSIEDNLDAEKSAQCAALFARFDCRLKNATRFILHLESLVHHLVCIIHGNETITVNSTALL